MELIFKSHSPWAEGLLLMEILFSVFCLSVFCDNFEPCDWSDCPKAFSLVETGSNVSEEEQVLGSTNLHKLVLTDKTGLGRN